MDSVPTVFITGQVRTELIGTDGFQEADVNGITMPIVKHRFMVQDPRYVPDYIHAAFHIASTGRPGPVARRHPPGSIPGGHRLRADHRYAEPARLQALDRGEHQADQGRRQGSRERAAARDLRRRRRDQRERLGGAPRALPFRQLPRHLHADGPRWVPRQPRAVARHARDARHPHGQLRDGQRRPDRLRRRPLRRPDHRASSPSSRRARSSSTSTSTRPRSRRTSRPTSRSSATPRRCCRS